MIPTPHFIDVIKAGANDAWGVPAIGETIPLEGNLRTQSKVVTNNNGEEVISNYVILFIGLVDVNLNDKFGFTEPNGEVVEKSPIQLKFMRDLDGSVGFTKVVL